MIFSLPFFKNKYTHTHETRLLYKQFVRKKERIYPPPSLFWLSNSLLQGTVKYDLRQNDEIISSNDEVVSQINKLLCQKKEILYWKIIQWNNELLTRQKLRYQKAK